MRARARAIVPLRDQPPAHEQARVGGIERERLLEPGRLRGSVLVRGVANADDALALVESGRVHAEQGEPEVAEQAISEGCAAAVVDEHEGRRSRVVFKYELGIGAHAAGRDVPRRGGRASLDGIIGRTLRRRRVRELEGIEQRRERRPSESRCPVRPAAMTHERASHRAVGAHLFVYRDVVHAQRALHEVTHALAHPRSTARGLSMSRESMARASPPPPHTPPPLHPWRQQPMPPSPAARTRCSAVLNSTLHILTPLDTSKRR